MAGTCDAPSVGSAQRRPPLCRAVARSATGPRSRVQTMEAVAPTSTGLGLVYSAGRASRSRAVAEAVGEPVGDRRSRGGRCTRHRGLGAASGRAARSSMASVTHAPAGRCRGARPAPRLPHRGALCSISQASRARRRAHAVAVPVDRRPAPSPPEHNGLGHRKGLGAEKAQFTVPRVLTVTRLVDRHRVTLGDRSPRRPAHDRARRGSAPGVARAYLGLAVSAPREN